jgi:hypothetical protein
MPHTTYQPPSFNTPCRLQPSPGYTGAYDHWGMLGPDDSEPNNLVGTEFCAVANYSQADENLLWGWSDVDCQEPSPALCRVLRECLSAG